MTKRHHLLKISTLVSLMSVLTMNESYGALQTATMPVQVTVVGHCTVSTNQLTLSDYDPAQVGATQTTATPITVNCPNNEGYSIGLGVGVNSTTFTNRKVVNPLNATLTYNLYKDNGFTQVWGDGSAGSTVLANQSGTGTPQNPIVYAQMTASQSATVSGTAANNVYTDTVLVSINY